MCKIRILNKVISETANLERNGSGVELRILDCGVKTLGKFFHSTLLQFTQLYK